MSKHHPRARAIGRTILQGFASLSLAYGYAPDLSWVAASKTTVTSKTTTSV